MYARETSHPVDYPCPMTLDRWQPPPLAPALPRLTALSLHAPHLSSDPYTRAHVLHPHRLLPRALHSRPPDSSVASPLLLPHTGWLGLAAAAAPLTCCAC